MGPKKGTAGPAAAKTEDEDLDALLTQYKAEVGIKEGEDAAAAKEEEESDDEETAGGGKEEGEKKEDKKKKKKKKKPAEKKEAAVADAKAAAGGKMSAQAKMILARQKALQEEEERLQQQREEEEKKIAAERAAEEAELAAKEEEKRLKKEKARAKMEKQKAEGTYMTKAQREKAMRARIALEQMKAAGMIAEGVGEGGAEGGGKPKRPVYGKKKKKPQPPPPPPPETAQEAPRQVPASAVKEHGGEEEMEEGVGEGREEAPAVDEDVPEDWESGPVEALAARVAHLDLQHHAHGYYEDEEDEMHKEREREREQYRLLGLARKKREEEERARQEEMDKEREEQDREQREAEYKKEEARKRRVAREEAALQSRSSEKLRSPICCIMGHVDTGKTKLLDNIRRTNVQEGEAGGITQQIGATFFPRDHILTRTKEANESFHLDVKLPGLLIIDTPGHESFTNLRSRGSTLCDIAILVIDLMHGLEPQTIESLQLLRRKRTPFVVALNKVDRCYAWKSIPNGPFRASLDAQEENTRREFQDRTDRIIVQLMEQSINSDLYWRNEDTAHTVSLVPTSAITGEGVCDLLLLLAKLTQERMSTALMYVETVQCTILEVKQVEGLGMTVDVVLVNGTLHEGDTIVVCTLDGPVVTTIRALLTPPPAKEIRVGSQFVHHQKIEAAMGIKIVATGLEKALAGTGIMVMGPDDDVEDIKEEVMRDITDVMGNLETDSRGVTVQASTLGALEALLEYLRKECKPPVPVARVGIGPIFKKDVTQTGTNIEKGLKEFACILAFDVKVDADARAHADELGVRIFTAEIIYHLFDQFSNYIKTFEEEKKEKAMATAVFPVILKIMPDHIFNAKDPIILGVQVLRGILRVNTPLVVTVGGLVELGVVTSIQSNHKELQQVGKGIQAAIKIENTKNPNIMFGRHFTAENPVYSRITRESIDALKSHFKDELSNDDWRLVIDLKKVFGIL